MAANRKPGDNRRKGAVRRRSQVKNPRTHTWTKRSKTTGRFMATKSARSPHKGVMKEE